MKKRGTSSTSACSASCIDSEQSINENDSQYNNIENKQEKNNTTTTNFLMGGGTGFVAGADTGGYLTHTYEEEQHKNEEKKRKANDNGSLNMNKFASALLNLSFNYRNQIEEEIHGVSCMSITETPILIEVSLYQFDIELNSIPIENKTAYIKILFDPSKSALRYSKYLDLIYEIFGECVLKRPIRLQEDFNSDELSFFKSGAYQLLPFRDRCGRRIFVGVSNEKVPQKLLSKIWLYLFFVCICGSDISNNDKNNLETQQKGVVMVNFPTPYGNDIKDARKRLDSISRIAQCIPVRIVAVHFCVPNSHLSQFLNSVLNSVYGTSSRPLIPRVRFHLGNPIEIRYKLQQFGIPIEHFPATDTGNIKLIYFKQWINLRTHLEYEEEKKINHNTNANTNSNNNIIVECPLSNDVIFRRGKTMNFHSGNVKFQNLIESHLYEYFINPDTTLSRRKEIEIEILNEILNSGGRFLTWITVNKWWLVIHSEDEVQFKIYHAFLGFRTRMLKKKQKQQKVLPTTLFEGQQVRQKKKRYNNNNCSSRFSDCGLHCDSDDNNSNNSGI
ncbi:hypothetical protein FRACYDRAFT_240962 [Fragilariopsis cylindrus CCMP1102]|uniref:DUF6824 domain-containing protein n=1 Tax=Fragilariopsis cylindrus CCMP1102 TaxID=635003 RepID=A0A1E7F9B3_9STRA|nr:hypothetical protein FRACYDRAFT_240962 [Fragilariopsis cylindrus CCMP1102]|eukprot:OEU14423.1 hypothetical protein FRACYDRAFT_240962 [Fragilariopsis cylindrus CCMP1102]